MAKRNNRIDTEVIALAVAGLPQRKIAEKLSVSQATVSKILHEEKTRQKLSNAQEVIENNQKVIKESNQKTAHNVIDKIINGLEKDLEKASLKDKRELLKTLVELFGLPDKEDEAIDEIRISFEDASGDNDGQGS